LSIYYSTQTRNDLWHSFLLSISSFIFINTLAYFNPNPFFVQTRVALIWSIFREFFLSLFLIQFLLIFPVFRIMARTKEDVASKGDSSPKIPKSSAGVTKNTAEPPVKRGRGRPPKGSAPMPKKVYVPTGRPRGRPPGGGKKKAAPTPKKVAAVNDDGTPKRGRGRPRRAAVAEDENEKSAATTPKQPKKRGRKPKSASPADASADEDKGDDAADDVSDKEASVADSPDRDEEDDDEE
jgi:hypothetical protein